jgi:hypothetical protein
MPTLEKENDYKDEQFDFMQYHLRKFCLECMIVFFLSFQINIHGLNFFRWCCIILYICKGEKEY